jgi:hypothetical protein
MDLSKQFRLHDVNLFGNREGQKCSSDPGKNIASHMEEGDGIFSKESMDSAYMVHPNIVFPRRKRQSQVQTLPKTAITFWSCISLSRRDNNQYGPNNSRRYSRRCFMSLCLFLIACLLVTVLWFLRIDEIIEENKNDGRQPIEPSKPDLNLPSIMNHPILSMMEKLSRNFPKRLVPMGTI